MSSNFERKARRKRQTRLTFDPVDKSSSPASHMSPANVRYQFPGQKQTKAPILEIDDDESDDILSTNKKTSFTPSKRERGAAKAPDKALPTPVKSSQLPLKPLKGNFDSLDEDENEDDSNPDLYSSATRKRRLGATESTQRDNIFGSGIGADKSDSSQGSPAEEEEYYTPSKVKRNVRSSASKRNSSTKPRRQKSVTLSDGSDVDALPARPSYKQLLFKTAAEKPIVISDGDSPPRLPSSSRRGRRQVVIDDDSGEDDSDEDELLVRTKGLKPILARRGPRQPAKLDDDDSDDIVAPSSTNRRLRASVSGDASDSEPVSSPPKRRRVVTEESDDSDIVASSPMKRRRMVRPGIDVADDESESDDLPTVRSLKARGNGEATPARITRQQTTRRHRTAKEKTMELLKRKRAGENITELTESEDDEEEEKGGVYDTDSDLQALSEFEDEEESPETSRQQNSKQRKQRTTNNGDEYDSEFVVDDDETMLGVPDVGLHDIPLEFTHAAHKPLKEHFRDAVEWMVQNKINPGFSRRDPLYLQAFRKLNYEYEALAKSKFASTQWTHEFTKALNARPIYLERPLREGEGIGIDGRPKCDACNHRSHIPTYAISFGGKAYNKETLEDVDQDSDSDSSNSDSDSDSDHHSVNEDGHEIPPESKEWFSGRFCRGNAQQAHTLSHWRYSLNQWVLDTLRTQNQLTPAKLARRDAMSSSKRTKSALRVVDDWEAKGLIKDLYRDFKAQLDTARESHGAGGKWGR